MWYDFFIKIENHKKVGIKLNLFKRQKKGVTLDDQIMMLADGWVRNEVNRTVNPIVALQEQLDLMSDPENEQTDFVQTFIKIPLSEHSLLLKQFIQEWQVVHQIHSLKKLDVMMNRFNEALLDLTQQCVAEIDEGYRTPLNVLMHLRDKTESDMSGAMIYLEHPTTVDFALTYLHQLSDWGEN